MAAIAASGALPAWAQGADAPRRLILVYLKGGNDGYNTVVPYTDKAYYAMRPNIAVPRDAAVRLDERFGLHPMLASIQPIWAERELAIVQGIGLPEVHDQHYSDYERLVTGTGPDEYSLDGWATRALLPTLANRDFDAVALDSLDIREGDAMGPFRGGKLRVINAPHPGELQAVRDFGKATHVTTPPLAGRSLLSYPPLNLATRFPEEPFGHALRAAVELARARPELPTIHITLDSLDGDRHHCFDTHWKQLDYHGEGLRRLGAGLIALRAALKEAGLWETTVVATYDEFGRSPRENKARGTEHGWASTQFLMGGRVRGGFHGRAPAIANVHWIGGDKPVIDYRQLYTTLIEHWWGGNAAGMFSQRFRPLDLIRA
ncbi:MAG: DUF1501 domain-containing protein [Betaproteobacteria bacterium]|nr:DUF1501 domain-containing protein [Betaproteobacteria bacterium]